MRAGLAALLPLLAPNLLRASDTPEGSAAAAAAGDRELLQEQMERQQLKLHPAIRNRQIVKAILDGKKQQQQQQQQQGSQQLGYRDT